jgi:glycosyltransferase involved in cell wall biosynthesis
LLTTKYKIRILGTRGIPAAHGGFETFAEYLALYLVERGWDVTAYCQVEGTGPLYEDVWQGVRRVNIPVDPGKSGSVGSVTFDWHATRHAAATGEPCLTLGYNTAVFCARLRLKNVSNIINMDGIEWRRAKWSGVAKAWFWANEWAGCLLANHLVADHPEIKKHLERSVASSKITVIPYGAETVRTAPTDPVTALGLQPGKYLSVIARAEPENSLLEIVRGYSLKSRPYRLAVLGNYDRKVSYQGKVVAAAGEGVSFLGAIYDKEVVKALRLHSAAYVHGHQVGGTNPSLVEALGAGNAIIAHDNRFNRWVAGPQAEYFSDAESFSAILDRLDADPARLDSMRTASRARHEEAFRWETVLADYERLLASMQAERVAAPAR